MGVNPSLLLAHGVAVRADLPLPFSLVLIGSALALLLSFVALGSLWTEPRLRGREAGRPLPRALAGALEAPELAWGLRILGLVAAGYVTVALFLGPDDAANPAAGALYILLWVGVVGLASALLGPVWRALNPLRTLHLLACRAVGRDPRAGAAAVPGAAGPVAGCTDPDVVRLAGAGGPEPGLGPGAAGVPDGVLARGPGWRGGIRQHLVLRR